MLRAKQIMTDNPVFVKKDTPIYEAVELLVQHNISGMPVVEDDMTLVGVISENYSTASKKMRKKQLLIL